MNGDLPEPEENDALLDILLQQQEIVTRPLDITEETSDFVRRCNFDTMLQRWLYSISHKHLLTFLDTELWPSASLKHRGLMSAGPRSMLNPKQGDHNYQREPCPRKVRIDFDTATLKRESTGRNSATLRLLPRCVLCSSEYEMSNITQMLGLVSNDPVSQTKCNAKGCPQERFYLSTHCSQHLFQAYLLRKAGGGPTEAENARCIEQASVTIKKWTLDKNSRFDLYLDTDARRRSGARIFALDLEGLLSENHVK